MSSELVLFEAVAAGAIETLFNDQNQPWFKRADLGRYVGIVDIRHMFKGIKTTPRLEIMGAQELGTRSGMRGGGKNSHDAFSNLDGVLEIVTKSRKPQVLEIAKALGINIHKQKFLSKEQETISIIMQVFKEIKMIDQYTVDLYFPEHKLAVECDELGHKDRDIDQEVKRQKFIEKVLKCTFIRYNPDDKDFKIEKVLNEIFMFIHFKRTQQSSQDGMVIIQKNNGDEYGYMAICGQQGYVTQKIKHKLIDYPNSNIVVLAETPNAIVHYNFLRERGCIIANPERVSHFRLGEHYTHRQLMELQKVQVLW